jgi:hypothetical protein
VTVSFVLRLVGDRLRSGDVVGEAENVATGERHVIGDVEQLVTFLQRSATEGRQPT